MHRARAQYTNADAFSQHPCAADKCQDFERREGHERELHDKEQHQQWQPAMQQAGAFIGRELRAVVVVEWREQQRQHPDMQPMHLWVESQQKPPWEEVMGPSLPTKGLWFEALCLVDGVLQRAWKELDTGEERWKVVVPTGLRAALLQAMHGAEGTGLFGVTKTLHQGFYWGLFQRGIENFCHLCDLCTA